MTYFKTYFTLLRNVVFFIKSWMTWGCTLVVLLFKHPCHNFFCRIRHPSLLSDSKWFLFFWSVQKKNLLDWTPSPHLTFCRRNLPYMNKKFKLCLLVLYLCWKCLFLISVVHVLCHSQIPKCNHLNLELCLSR